MATLRIKLPEIDDVFFDVFATEDSTPVRGNAQASGDDADDKKVEDGIIRRLKNGDVWAWACVSVTGRYKAITATEYLGACCYNNAMDFMKNSGYYEDMKKTVFDEIIKQIRDLK